MDQKGKACDLLQDKDSEEPPIISNLVDTVTFWKDLTIQAFQKNVAIDAFTLFPYDFIVLYLWKSIFTNNKRQLHQWPI